MGEIRIGDGGVFENDRQHSAAMVLSLICISSSSNIIHPNLVGWWEVAVSGSDADVISWVETWV